jgi:hypothetical protein
MVKQWNCNGIPLSHKIGIEVESMDRSAPLIIRSGRREAGGHVAALDVELNAYRQEAPRLEASHMGKWVIFRGSALVSIHETLEAAAEDAVAQFGHGPYLIRQIGAAPIVIPVSLVYNPNA